jgi:hypothetical protein
MTENTSNFQMVPGAEFESARPKSRDFKSAQPLSPQTTPGEHRASKGPFDAVQRDLAVGLAVPDPTADGLQKGSVLGHCMGAPPIAVLAPDCEGEP